MRRRRDWGRREWLGKLAGASATLGTLPWLSSSRAGNPAPRRIMFVVTSHGTVYDNWRMRPGARPEDADWEAELGSMTLDEFSEILRPLHPLRDRIDVLDGLAIGPVAVADINAHETGQATCLTGTMPVEIEGGLARAMGPSLDQIIADEIGRDTPFRSLELSVGGWPVVFDAAGRPMPYESDPWRAYDRVFPTGDSSDPTRRSVLASQADLMAFVDARYRDLAPRLPPDDRAKLESHRALVERLHGQMVAIADAQCDAPERAGAAPDWGAPQWPQFMNDAMFSIAQVALACDLTRVLTFRVDILYNSTLDAPPGDIHNDYAHSASTNPESMAIMTRYHRFHAERLAELLTAMDGIPEADGSLLDHTLVVWINELATGEHTAPRWPVVLAGGGLARGRYLHWAQSERLAAAWNDVMPIGAPHNRLLVSLARHMGLTIDQVGVATLPRSGGGVIDCTGGLDRV